MGNIEIELIEHKSTFLYFKDFFKEHSVHQLAYKLQRMFEKGTAIYGDYFLIKIDNKPFMTINGDRNNCQRIFTSDIHFNLNTKEEDREKYFPEIIKKVINHILENEDYFSINQSLKFEIYDQFKFNDKYKEILQELKFINHTNDIEYRLNINSPKLQQFINNNLELYKTKNIITNSVEKRYNLIKEIDNHPSINNRTTPIEAIYNDYIECGVRSEELWQVIYNENDIMIGLLMPVIENLAYKEIRLLKYSLSKKINYNKEKIINTILDAMIKISLEEQYEKITFSIPTNDLDFIENLKNLDAEKDFSVSSWIKNKKENNE